MRDFTGIPFASLPDPKSPDFVPRLRNMLGVIDGWATDVSQAMARISAGQGPSGSGVAVQGNARVSLDNSGTNIVQPVGPSANIQEWRDSTGALQAWIDPFGAVNMKQINMVTLGPPVSKTVTFNNVLGIIQAHFLFIKSGTGDLDSGSTVATVDNTGLGTFTAVSSSSVGCDVLTATGVSDVQQIIAMAFAGQTANIQEWQDSSSAPIAWVTPAGAVNTKLAGSNGPTVPVGTGTSSAGLLGAINLTAQTGSLTARTLLTGGAGTAGNYRLSFYLKTTTAGNAGDTVKVTAAWDDGSAQTLDIPFINATVIFNTLDLGTLNAFAQGSIIVRAAASQNVTFTTTVVKAGTPQYLISARIEALG